MVSFHTACTCFLMMTVLSKKLVFLQSFSILFSTYCLLGAQKAKCLKNRERMTFYLNYGNIYNGLILCDHRAVVIFKTAHIY